MAALYYTAFCNTNIVDQTHHVCELLKYSSDISYGRLHFMQSLIPAGQVVVLRSRQHQLLLLLLLQERLPAT